MSTHGAQHSASPCPNPCLRSRQADICASFQRVVVETLLDRLFDAAGWYQARSVGIAGGVSANSRLRADAATRGQVKGLPVFVPSLVLSTDNAAMIAAAGLRRFRQGTATPVDPRATTDTMKPLTEYRGSVRRTKELSNQDESRRLSEERVKKHGSRLRMHITPAYSNDGRPVHSRLPVWWRAAPSASTTHHQREKTRALT